MFSNQPHSSQTEHLLPWRYNRCFSVFIIVENQSRLIV